MTGCHRPEGKPIFDIHDTTSIRYLFQLKLGLSPLRSHKDRYGFGVTPSATAKHKCVYLITFQDRVHMQV